MHLAARMRHDHRCKKLIEAVGVYLGVFRDNRGYRCPNCDGERELFREQSGADCSHCHTDGRIYPTKEVFRDRLGREHRRVAVRRDAAMLALFIMAARDTSWKPAEYLSQPAILESGWLAMVPYLEEFDERAEALAEADAKRRRDEDAMV